MSIKSSILAKGRVDRLFVDTWGWLALADARDPAHSQVVAERRLRTTPGALVTTDYVLDETITRLFARCQHAVAQQFCDALVEAGETGFLTVERISAARFSAAYQMRVRYRDKPDISFTDLTSFAVMKDLGITNVLTADAHFTQVHLGFRRVP